MMTRLGVLIIAGLAGTIALADEPIPDPSGIFIGDELLVADNPRNERRDGRQDGRGDNRDDRQECRDEEGLGKDKRECKRDDDDDDDDGAEAHDDDDEKNA